MVYLEHAEDIFSKWLDWHLRGKVALVIVTKTEGGAVRAPGAMMAVSEQGERAGYISGGCVDADAAMQAQNALKTDEIKALKYGRGSPFIDLPLPCGGSIEIVVIPNPERAIIEWCYSRLQSRNAVTIWLSQSGVLSIEHGDKCEDLVFRFTPKLQLRIAGRGPDCIALARLASASGIRTYLQLVDQNDIAMARELGVEKVIALTHPSDPGSLLDDPWTAFLLAFHDVNWEQALLSQAVQGPAFYIGAVGSKKTQMKRRELLQTNGLTEIQLNRIRGPVGLVPSLRDASMLAVSILSEIIDSYHQKKQFPFRNTALIMLAAGQSSRFGAGDKLLSTYQAQPLIDHASKVLCNETVATRIGIVAPEQHERARILQKNGWSVKVNQHANIGMATSIACGVREVEKNNSVDAVLILLSDMPHILDSHLFDLRDSLTLNKSAAFSQRGFDICPPAIFSRHMFDQITSLSGDIGAKQLLNSVKDPAIVPMSSWQAHDIDTLDDLVSVTKG